jgi:Peptidase family M23
MARIKYYYDTETCKYERVKISRWDVFLNALGFFTLALILSFTIVYFYSSFFELPIVTKLKKDNRELLMNYEILSDQVKTVNNVLKVLRDRDDNIYRKIFEAEPIPLSIWEGGVGGVDRYKSIIDSKPEREELIVSTYQEVDKLKRQLYIQMKSYDDIEKMAANKAKMLIAIPSIQPIANKELIRLASGFGMRMHPILKVRRPHNGIDFSADPGTPIYATGDATVKRAGMTGTFGNMVELDHGFGYETRYAHMSKINVSVGQKVKRGDVIGFVGTTGLSTAPHLHYEVWKDNKPVNPVYYFYQDVTDTEFDKLIELANRDNQSLGGGW